MTLNADDLTGAQLLAIGELVRDCDHTFQRGGPQETPNGQTTLADLVHEHDDPRAPEGTVLAQLIARVQPNAAGRDVVYGHVSVTRDGRVTAADECGLEILQATGNLREWRDYAVAQAEDFERFAERADRELGRAGDEDLAATLALAGVASPHSIDDVAAASAAESSTASNVHRSSATVRQDLGERAPAGR